MLLSLALAAALLVSTPPERREIVIASARDGDTELYLLREDGSGLRRLTWNRATDYGAVWALHPTAGASPSSATATGTRSCT
jgi:hypothetical protein